MLGAAPAAVAGAEDVRAEFRAILYAPGVPREESAELKGYVLYPYVEAARLRWQLTTIADKSRDATIEQDVKAFLAAHAGAPVAQPLLRDYLLFLAARQDWMAYLASLPVDTSDVALKCHALAARIATGDFTGLRDAILPVWLERRGDPAACAPAFDWIESAGRLFATEVEKRAIFAARMRDKQPKIVARLPESRRTLMAQWDKLMADPVKELERFLASPDAATRWPAADIAPALIEAFSRATRRSAMQAKAVLPALEKLPVFDDSQRVEIRRLMAMGFAYDFDVEAIGYFASLPDNVLDQSGREWRVRSALLHEAWPTAEQWIAMMPADQQKEARWLYWRGRVLSKMGKEAEGRAFYEQAAKEREFYAFLAAERLGRKPNLRPKKFEDNRKLKAEIAARPAMVRAKELFLCNYQDLATAELRYALRDDDSATRAQAAKLTWEWGWYVQALKALAELQQWDDLELRFPLPYDAQVDAASRISGIPGSWIYSVLRTESLYDPRAVSGAGALGLVQLTPDTARAVAKRAGLARPTRDDLFDPAVNLSLGARYLAEMQARFQGRLIYTLAAYNAGPEKALEWTPVRTVDADVWIENIPFNETRGYVQRALSNLAMIEWRRTGKTADLLPLLQPLGPDRQDAAP